MPSLEQCKVNQVLGSVATELDLAMIEHEPMHSRHEAHSVILEELDEFWDEVKKNPNKMSPDARLQWYSDMRKELIQTAAMAVRAIVDLNLQDFTVATTIYNDMLPKGEHV